MGNAAEMEPSGLEREPLDEYIEDVEPGGGECVDERGLVGGKERKNHIKVTGASVNVVDMFEVAFHEAGIDNMNLPRDASGEEVDADKLARMTKAVHETDKAREIGFGFGVHIDDDHGHITDESVLAVRKEGCGHDRVRQHSLQVALGVNIPNERANMVPACKRAGAEVVAYSGGHIKGARAVENNRKGKTFSSQRALVDGLPAFDNDIWAMVELAEEMADQVRALGDEYSAAADLLTKDNVRKWSGLIYRETLRDLGGPADDVEVIQ